MGVQISRYLKLMGVQIFADRSDRSACVDCLPDQGVHNLFPQGAENRCGGGSRPLGRWRLPAGWRGDPICVVGSVLMGVQIFVIQIFIKIFEVWWVSRSLLGRWRLPAG
jgi:hypothetical protein